MKALPPSATRPAATPAAGRVGAEPPSVTAESIDFHIARGRRLRAEMIAAAVRRFMGRGGHQPV